MISFAENVIIGAGLTGLSTAYHLKGNYALLEKNFVAGGTASSDNIEGFVFDKAGHLLHFQTDYIQEFITRIIKNNKIKKFKRTSWIYSKNIYTRYPFQINTYQLPIYVVKDCLFEMAKIQHLCKRKKKADNLHDWVLENFGEGIAKHFMFPYNRKLWRFPLSSIGIDWVDKFIPKAHLGSAIKGAVSDFKKGFGYNRIFYYPDRGGIQTLSNALIEKILAKIYFNTKVVDICLKNRTVTDSNGKKIRFNKIISTMPLPELIKIIKNISPAIRDAAKKLRYVSVFNLNLGIDRECISDKHWIYFPEKKYIFYRVGFFTNFSNHVSPKGKSALYAEVSYTQYKPLKCNGDRLKEKIIRDLIRAGILKEKDRILAEKAYDIKYAYPVCDKNNFTEPIKKLLESYGVYSIGRYGSWRYMSMEESIIEGRLTAARINYLNNR